MVVRTCTYGPLYYDLFDHARDAKVATAKYDVDVVRGGTILLIEDRRDGYNIISTKR